MRNTGTEEFKLPVPRPMDDVHSLFMSTSDEIAVGPCSGASVLASGLRPQDATHTEFDSVAFVLYALIVSLINLYATSGRNASTGAPRDGGAIELTQSNKWYAPVPAAEVEPVNHVIGDEED